MSEEKYNGIPDNIEDKDVQYDLIEGLLAAGSFMEDEDLQKKIEIRRNGKHLFTFTIRPISENDVKVARKKSTKMLPNPAGKSLPKIEGETDMVALRSWKIYLATVDEDQKKIWGNPVLKEKFGILEPWQAVDKLLLGGEKSYVSDLIDEISGYNDDMTEFAKN